MHCRFIIWVHGVDKGDGKVACPQPVIFHVRARHELRHSAQETPHYSVGCRARLAANLKACVAGRVVVRLASKPLLHTSIRVSNVTVIWEGVAGELV